MGKNSLSEFPVIYGVTISKLMSNFNCESLLSMSPSIENYHTVLERFGIMYSIHKNGEKNSWFEITDYHFAYLNLYVVTQPDVKVETLEEDN